MLHVWHRFRPARQAGQQPDNTVSRPRCAILFPHGVLFRDEEHQMRTKLLDLDVIECVLGLGPNLFYNSPMEACVVICRMRKPPECRNRILFINAVNEVTRDRAQSFFTEAHIQNIVQAYHACADVDGFAKVATLDDVRANNANLNIPLYVRAPRNGNGSPALESSLEIVIDQWQASSHALRTSMQDLFTMLDAAGLRP
jgi:type I restriction enzyme M protein